MAALRAMQSALHAQLLAGKATAVLLKTDVINYIDVTFTLYHFVMLLSNYDFPSM